MRSLKATFIVLAGITLTACSSDNGQTDPVCGNDQIEGTEECDKTRLDGKTCADFGFDTGALTCSAQCTFDTASCENTPEDCGNGDIDAGEDCDGENLGDTTCEDLGHLGGELACAADCTFDQSACEVDPCGDGVIAGEEECDGADLNDWTCEDFGFTGGSLACTDECRLDATGCTGCIDDGLEENDDLAGAALISEGFTDLTLCTTGGEEDWFSLELLTGDVLVVELTQADPFVDIDLELIKADGLVLASSSTLGTEERIVYTAVQDGEHYLRVFAYADRFGAVDYTLNVVENPDCFEHLDCLAGEVCEDYACIVFLCSDENPCPDGLVCDAGSCVECVAAADCPEEDAYTCDNNLCIYDCLEDAYEPNSTQGEATPIAVGFDEAGLTLCGDADEDWFSLELEALHAYDLSVTFTHADGDIDVEVYAADDDESPMAVGYSSDDDEIVTIPVGTDEAGTYLIRVRQPLGELAQTYRITIVDSGVIECAWDTDCPTEGDICQDFQCVTPDCIEDADCTAPDRCMANVCVAPPVGDSCDDAIVVDTFPFTDADVDMGPHRNAVAFDETVCTEWGTAGNDVIYQVALTAGQGLYAVASADFDVALVITSECSATPAADSCLYGADEGFEGEDEEVYYLAEADITVYLVVDTFVPLFPSEGSFTLTIEVD